MASPLILASASPIRAKLLAQADVSFTALPARIDEEALRAAALAEGANARSIADLLAEQKALKLSARNQGALVLGCDQVLEHDGAILSKPATLEAARAQLLRLRGQTHQLHSAAVLARDGRPLWRTIETVSLTMRPFSDAWLAAYLSRHWPGLRDTVGGYKLEEEGVRLFSRIDGSYFAVLGLPLLPLLDQLSVMKAIPA